MANPFSFIEDIRNMNESLTGRLDQIIEQLELLVQLADAHNKLDSGENLYGDGR